MSRILQASFALVLVLAGFSRAEEPRGRVMKTSMDFSEHLDGPAVWAFGPAGILTLKMEGDSTVFLRNGDEEVFRLNAPEYIDEALRSEDGNSLVLVAMKSRGFGSDFGTLVKVQPEAGKLKIGRELESGRNLFGENRWWLSELGAVSNDGTRILAKLGVDAPDSNRMGYRWYTVELASGKILGEGLTIENGKKPPAEETSVESSMKNVGTKNELSAAQRDELLKVLEARFEKNMKRHQGLEWAKVNARLEANAGKLWSLNEMERTGGEPDVVGHDEKTGEYLFFDCSPESPKGRVSVCYDREGLDSRKEHKPANNAIDMAAAMGIELLTEEQYRELQELGEFDRKTSSWIQSPADFRKLGGALFGDRRFGRVFIYHNGAQSYYSARGFRGSLRV